MNIIVEGLDMCGKSTLIRNLQDHFYFRNPMHIVPVQLMYYSNFKTPTAYSKQISELHYQNGFDLIKQSVHHNTHIIFDRFHIGESVYSPMYRKYNGDYVFDMEKKYERFLSDTLLIVLVDSAENLIERDDGLSHTTDLKKKRLEVQSFITAFEKSIIPSKILIDIKDKTIAQVLETVIWLISNPPREKETGHC